MLFQKNNKILDKYDFFLIAKAQINDLKYNELEDLFIKTIKKLQKQGEKQ